MEWLIADGETPRRLAAPSKATLFRDGEKHGERAEIPIHHL